MFASTRLFQLPVSVLSRNIKSRTLHSQQFWQWTTKDRPFWTKDAKECVLACTVFAITGSTSMLLVRPTVEKVFGIQGSLLEGPNSYRVISILCVSPIYAMLLGVLGTLAGRHVFFSRMAVKILGRFMPKSLSHKLLCKPAQVKLSSK